MHLRIIEDCSGAYSRGRGPLVDFPSTSRTSRGMSYLLCLACLAEDQTIYGLF
jgi:endo-1,4-beta-D-glucanase Y